MLSVVLLVISILSTTYIFVSLASVTQSQPANVARGVVTLAIVPRPEPSVVGGVVSLTIERPEFQSESKGG